MEATWFCLAFFMLAMYAVVNRFDLGAGLMAALLARTGRRQVSSIAWSFSSLLLGVALGAAVGCVIGGVPPTSGSRILFVIMCGVLALAVMTFQSAVWTALKSNGELQQRCCELASRLWWVVLALCGGVSLDALALEPRLLERLQAYSSISLIAILALAGLIGARLCLSVKFDLGAFASASCLIAGILATAAASLQNGPAVIGIAPAFLLVAGYRAKAAASESTAPANPHPALTTGR